MHDKARDLLPMVRKCTNVPCNTIPQSLSNSLCCGGAGESATLVRHVPSYTMHAHLTSVQLYDGHSTSPYPENVYIEVCPKHQHMHSYNCSSRDIKFNTPVSYTHLTLPTKRIV